MTPHNTGVCPSLSFSTVPLYTGFLALKHWDCISFLLLLKHVAIRFLVSNNTDLFYWALRAKKKKIKTQFHWAKMKELAGLVPPRWSDGTTLPLPFPASRCCSHSLAHPPAIRGVTPNFVPILLPSFPSLTLQPCSHKNVCDYNGPI